MDRILDDQLDLMARALCNEVDINVLADSMIIEYLSELPNFLEVTELAPDQTIDHAVALSVLQKLEVKLELPHEIFAGFQELPENSNVEEL